MAEAKGITSGVSHCFEEDDISAGAETVALDGSSLNFDSELRSFKRELWQSKKLSDFTLKAGGQYFEVHKWIIAAHMSYYGIDSSELSQDSAILDMDSDILELVLQFLYLGHLEVPKDSIPRLQNAAEYLGVRSLQIQCRYASMCGVDLTANNCLEVWSVALDVDNQVLSTKALQSAVKHFEDIQHDSKFTELPVVCLMQILSHPELKLQSADEALAAALSWLTADPDARVEHLPTILDLIPLEDMQAWHLKQVMHNPVVRTNKEAYSLIKAVVEGGRPIKHPNSQVSDTHKAPKAQNSYWVTFTVVRKISQPTKATIWSVSLSDDLCIKEVGLLQGPDIRGFVRMCGTDTGDLFIGGLGPCKSELWTYNLHTQAHTVIGMFTTGRDRHAMCYRDGHVYILGGRDDGGNNISSVEVFNPLNGKTRAAGSLKYDGLIFCHSDAKMDCMVLFGARDSAGHPTVQLYSVTQETTVGAVSLPWDSTYSSYGIVAVDNNTFLLFTGDFTAVCSMDDIKQGKSSNIRKCDKYVAPNNYCGVVRSADGKFVMLLGGEPKLSNPDHFVYRAVIHDIVHNSGSGWEKVAVKWSLGACRINAQTTVTLS